MEHIKHTQTYVKTDIQHFFHILNFAILECSQHNNVYTMLIIVQRDATQSSLFITLQVHSTCFGCQAHPSSGVHKTVTTASGTSATSFQRGQAIAWPRWLNRLLFVASRWTIINIDQRCTNHKHKKRLYYILHVD